MVVDANVVAYAIFGPEEYRQTAWNALRMVDRVVVPDLFFSEYASAVWQWVRGTSAGVAEFVAALDDAEALIERVVPSRHLWRSALGHALRAEHPVYDAIYVAAAEQLESRVVTFDGRLLRAFPDRTVDARSI